MSGTEEDHFYEGDRQGEVAESYYELDALKAEDIGELRVEESAESTGRQDQGQREDRHGKQNNDGLTKPAAPKKRRARRARRSSCTTISLIVNVLFCLATIGLVMLILSSEQKFQIVLTKLKTQATTAIKQNEEGAEYETGTVTTTTTEPATSITTAPATFIRGETCPPEWVTRSDGKACFYIENGLERNWTQAESYCVDRRGHLVSIMNPIEQKEIEGLMEANGFEYLFLGLNDIGAENNWVWSSGKLSSYTHWDMYQPDNKYGTQDCAALKTTERWKGYWDDEWCHLTRTFFCQMDLFK